MAKGARFELSGLQLKLLFLVALPLLISGVAVTLSTTAFNRIRMMNGYRVEDLERAKQIRGAAVPSPDIEVITFTSETPAQLGLGQDVTVVPRRIHAQLLSLLDKAGAKAALVDVMFSAPKPGDSDFATTLKSFKTLKVTLATSYDEHPVRPGTILSGSFLPISVWPNEHGDSVRVASVFADKSDPGNLLIGGHVFQRDATSGRRYLYAPLSVALQAHDIPADRLKLDPEKLVLKADPLQWNLDSNCSIQVRWTKDAAPFKHWDFIEAMKVARDHPDTFKGKVLLIGYKGAEDAHDSAPFGQIYGIDFLAQMTNTTLLAYDAQFRSIPDSLYYPYCLLLGLATALCFRLRHVVLTAIPILLLAGVAVGLQRFAATQWDTYLSASGPLGVILIAAVFGTLTARYWTDSIDLSPPSSSEEATVLFLDIIGSTVLLNRIGRPQYQALLDALFPKYTACVVRHGGQIERTMGDGFIAVFRKRGKRNHALRCADCCKELIADTDRIGKKFGIDVKVALGLESGIVGGGYVAEGKKQVWSSSGSAVHLAQRLQTLSGQLKLEVAVGPVARRLISTEQECPVVTHAVVKGFEEQVEVSQLIR